MTKIAGPAPSWVIFVTLVWVLNAGIFSTAQASDCPQRITFLPQSHHPVISSTKPTEADVLEIAQSQFQIAKYLEAHAGVPIFSEQIDQDVTAESMVGDLKTLSDQLKSLFPSGIPKKFTDLSVKQRDQLARAGADGVLFFTGRIPKLYKVVPNRAVQDEIFAKIKIGLSQQTKDGRISEDSETYRLITTVRERLALTEIRNYFAAHPNEKNVILMYGRLHNFKRHDDIFPRRCIEIPAGF